MAKIDDVVTKGPTTASGKAADAAANAAMSAASGVLVSPARIRRLLVVVLLDGVPDGETNLALAANDDPDVVGDVLKHEAFAMIVEVARQIGERIGHRVVVEAAGPTSRN